MPSTQKAILFFFLTTGIGKYRNSPVQLNKMSTGTAKINSTSNLKNICFHKGQSFPFDTAKNKKVASE